MRADPLPVDHGHGLLLKALALLAGGILLFTGCVTNSPNAATDLHVIREGDSVRYTIEGQGGSGHLLLLFHGREQYSFPITGFRSVVRAELTLTDASGETHRTLRLDPKTGALMSIGDLDTERSGSEQYRAATDQWAGSPFGAPDAFRCVAGLLVPITVMRTLDASAMVEFSAGGAWEPTREEIRRENTLVGSFHMGGGNPWPSTAAWTESGGAVCALTLAAEHRGNGQLLFGEDAFDPPPTGARVEIANGIPPAGAPGLAFTLEDAAKAALLDPTVRLYRRDHPQAWLIEARYSGTVGGDGGWTLAYGATDAPDKVVVNVGRVATKAVPQSPSAAFPSDFTLPLAALSNGVIPAERPLGYFAGRLTPGTDFSLEWYTARDATEASNADAAVWQLGAPSGEAWETLVYSATDDRPLARIVGPRFH